MVINEKGLTRAMKEAYRSGGYRVIASGDGENPVITIYATTWIIQVKLSNMPRKALGLIAEHAGRLPSPGEAYRIRKDDTQNEIYAVAAKPIEDILKKTATGDLSEVKLTELQWGDCQVWQKEDLGVVLMNPKLMSIANLKGNTYMVDDAMCVRGNISRVYIWPVRPKERDKHIITHLEQMQWVPWE